MTDAKPVPSGVLSNWFYGCMSCGCGDPQSVLDELREWLECLDNDTVYELRAARLDQSTSGLVWAWMSMLDNAGLTEHGTCLPGWLTTAGKRVLEAIRQHPSVAKWEDGVTAEEYEEWGWWPNEEERNRSEREDTSRNNWESVVSVRSCARTRGEE